MQPVSTRLPDDTHATLAAEADERDTSISALVREYTEKGLDYDDLERENERLRNEKRALIRDREERTELVRYAEAERERQRARRARRSAPAWTRAKWWLLGEPTDRNGAETPAE